jgi:hypothetical protein
VPVEDSLEAIVKAMGGEASMIQGVKVQAGKSSVPVAEY